MSFRYEQYRSPYIGSISDLLQRPGEIEARRALQVGDAQARAAEQQGQIVGGAIQSIGQQIASIPGQQQQQRRVVQQDALVGMQISEQKRAIQARDAFAQIIKDTPQLDEDGVSLYDVAAVGKQLAALGMDPGDAVKHLGGINEAFRAEKAAKLALVKRGAEGVIAAGNDPVLAGHFLDQLQKNGTYPAEQIDQFRQFIAADPGNVAKLTASLVGKREIGTAAPGSTIYDKGTGATVSTVPDDPNKGAYTVNGQRFKADGTPIGAAVPPQVQPAAAQTHNMRLQGVGDVPVDYVPNKDGSGGVWMYQGQDVSGKVAAIPPASVQINNAAAAEAKGPITALAQSMADYKVPPLSPRSMASGAGRALMEQVLRANPDYDATHYPERQKMRLTFTSGPVSESLNSLNTAIGHLDQFVDVAKALDNGNFRPGNDAYNWFKKTFGDSAPTNFAGIKGILSGELASAFKKSGATDQEIASVESAISASNSTSQLVDYATTIAIPALGSKVASRNAQYRQVMGERDPFKVLSPDAEAVLLKYGFDPAHPTMGGGGNLTRNAAPKEGETKEIPGFPGTEQKFVNGKWIRTK